MLASPLLSVAGAALADGTMIPTRAEIENTKRLRRNKLARLRHAAKAAAELELAGEYYNLEFFFFRNRKTRVCIFPEPILRFRICFSAQPFQHNFRPQGLNGETLPFLFRDYYSRA